MGKKFVKLPDARKSSKVGWTCIELLDLSLLSFLRVSLASFSASLRRLFSSLIFFRSASLARCFISFSCFFLCFSLSLTLLPVPDWEDWKLISSLGETWLGGVEMASTERKIAIIGIVLVFKYTFNKMSRYYFQNKSSNQIIFYAFLRRNLLNFGATLSESSKKRLSKRPKHHLNWIFWKQPTSIYINKNKTLECFGNHFLNYQNNITCFINGYEIFEFSFRLKHFWIFQCSFAEKILVNVTKIKLKHLLMMVVIFVSIDTTGKHNCGKYQVNGFYH